MAYFPEFAEAMGIRGFDFGDTGVACFEIEGAGSFYMEQKEEGVLMYLAREIDPFNSLPLLESALAECHYIKEFSLSFTGRSSGKSNGYLFICG